MHPMQQQQYSFPPPQMYSEHPPHMQPTFSNSEMYPADKYGQHYPSPNVQPQHYFHENTGAAVPPMPPQMLNEQFSSMNINATNIPPAMAQGDYQQPHQQVPAMHAFGQVPPDYCPHPSSQPNYNQLSPNFNHSSVSHPLAGNPTPHPPLVQPNQMSELNDNTQISFPPNQYKPPMQPSFPPMPPMPPQVTAATSRPMAMPLQPPMPSPHVGASQGFDSAGYQATQHQHQLSQPPMPPGQHGYLNNYSSGPQPATKRLSADGMPSAVEVMESDRNVRKGCFQTGQRGVCPPLVTTDFSCRDEGNCNPRFVRSSLYSVPATSDLMKNVGVPLSLTISPFATLHPCDPGIMISNMGPQGPVRCVRCKAYMNPFATFIDGGRRFQCPFCGALSEVPTEYFEHLDHTGRRTDTFQRPELCLGSYELVATAEYCKNNELPQSPAFIFLLDVSQAAVRSGLVQLFCSRFVQDILPHLPRSYYGKEHELSPVRIGFITYDHQLHFYSVATTTNPDGSHEVHAKPQMHIVADTADVFVPAVEGFLVQPDPNVLTSLLNLVPAQFGAGAGESANQPPDALLGPAIQAGMEALRAANRPGKLFVLHSGLPTAEAPGKLKNRDDRRAVGTDREKNLLNPSVDYYTGLGNACVEVGCGVDLFLFPNAYTDVATLGEVARLTSGHIYKYNCFQADLQGHQFMTDIAHAVSRARAFNGVMRVRTSTGMRPVDFLGNYYMPNTTDMELVCVDEDQGFTVELKHDDKLPDGDIVFIQVACLYTSVEGERRIRVHNLSLVTSNTPSDIFLLVDLDAHMNWLLKSAIRSCFNRTQSQIEDDITSRVAGTLATYRRHCCPGGQGASPGELVLPENMKLYPLYASCLMKTDALRPAVDISIDDRSLMMFVANGMSVKASNAYLYPRVYPAHTLSTDSEGELQLPNMLRCSYERMQADSVYLLENGFYLFLWLGTSTPVEWMQAVFGVQNVHHMEVERVYELPERDNDTSRQLRGLIDRIRTERSRHMRLLVVRQGEKPEVWFKRFMFEDRIDNNSMSYVEYLCHVHKEVRSLLR